MTDLEWLEGKRWAMISRSPLTGQWGAMCSIAPATTIRETGRTMASAIANLRAAVEKVGDGES